MIRKTIIVLCVIGMFASCVSTPEKTKEVVPENVKYYTAFQENNLKIISPVRKNVTEQTEIIISAPEDLVLFFNVKNLATGQNINTVFHEKNGSEWKVIILFPEKGDYELNILIEKGKNFYHGAAVVTYSAELPENSSLYVFKTDDKDIPVRVKDVQEVNERWLPGNLEFYWTSYTKYRTGTLINDTVFTINKHVFPLAAGTQIRFNTGNQSSKCLGFILPADTEIGIGDYNLLYKQGSLFYADFTIFTGYIAKDTILGFNGAELNCPADSAVAFRNNMLYGVQLSKNAELTVQKTKYPCTNYVYADNTDNTIFLTLAADTALKSGNTKLTCPALSRINISATGIRDIYLSKDTTITVDGKSQLVKAYFMIFFDDKGNLKMVTEVEGK